MSFNDALIIPANHKTVIGQVKFWTQLGKKNNKEIVSVSRTIYINTRFDRTVSLYTTYYILTSSI